jgi:hypothetical protein
MCRTGLTISALKKLTDSEISIEIDRAGQFEVLS